MEAKWVELLGFHNVTRYDKYTVTYESPYSQQEETVYYRIRK